MLLARCRLFYAGHRTEHYRKDRLDTTECHTDSACISANELDPNGSLGANTVTLKSTATPAITTSGVVKGGIFTGMTNVAVSTLSSDTTLNIESGGLLSAGTIAAGGLNGTVKENGVLELSALSLVKTTDKFNAIRMDATSTAGQFQGTSAIAVNPDGYEFDGTAISGLPLEDGSIVNITSEDPLKSSLYLAIADGLGSSVKTTYNGTVTLAGLTANLTIAQANAFLAEQTATAGCPFASPGAILHQHVLLGDDATKPIEFTATGDLTTTAIGFSSIANASGLHVGMAREVALVGLDAIYGDSNVLASAVTVDAGGKFTLGSQGTGEAHAGSVGSVKNDGWFRLKNGSWRIVGTLTGSGSITIDSDATLAVAVLALDPSTTNSTIQINGTLSLDGSTSSGVLASGITANVNGTLDASGFCHAPS